KWIVNNQTTDDADKRKDYFYSGYNQPAGNDCICEVCIKGFLPVQFAQFYSSRCVYPIRLSTNKERVVEICIICYNRCRLTKESTQLNSYLMVIIIPLH